MCCRAPRPATPPLWAAWWRPRGLYCCKPSTIRPSFGDLAREPRRFIITAPGIPHLVTNADEAERLVLADRGEYEIYQRYR